MKKTIAKKKKTETISVKGFKGFYPGMICIPLVGAEKRYHEGGIYREAGAKTLCVSGMMHFCQNPLSVLKYYNPCTCYGLSEYAEVKGAGQILIEKGSDEKCGASTLRVNKKLTQPELLSEAENFFKMYGLENPSSPFVYGTLVQKAKVFVSSGADKIKMQSAEAHSILVETGINNMASAFGLGSITVAKDWDSLAIVEAGNSLAVCLDGSSGARAKWSYSTALTQKFNSMAVCDGVKSTAVCYGMASSATALNHHSAAVVMGVHSGAVCKSESSVAVCLGDHGVASAENHNSVAVQLGKYGKCRGAEGSWLVLAETDNSGVIRNIKAVQVDGDEIKAGVFYQLKNGEFVPEDFQFKSYVWANLKVSNKQEAISLKTGVEAMKLPSIEVDYCVPGLFENTIHLTLKTIWRKPRIKEFRPFMKRLKKLVSDGKVEGNFDSLELGPKPVRVSRFAFLEN